METPVRSYVMDAAMLQQFLGLKGGFGKLVARIVMKVLDIDKANEFHARCMGADNAPDYSRSVLKEVGVSYELPESHLDRIPAEGGFITVSNHAFGSLDGLILCDTIGRKRPDYKLLTTFLLSLIPNLKDSFLPVDNLSSRPDAQSVNGIRMALRHISEGGPIGFFPSGEVSSYQKKEQRTALGDEPVIEDVPWAGNIVKLIKKSGFPVVPVYFDGTNSKNFHALGRIHPRLRTVRLVHELFNKKGTVIKVRIGQPITPAEVEGMDLETFGKYIRSRTYALEAECRESAPKKEEKPMAPIAPPVAPELIKADIDSLSDKVLFETGDYRCYVAKAERMPSVMKEIARMREEIFRAVGEGTGNPEDTDQYDTYFDHLILWNIPDGRIAGSYRLGFGNELVQRGEGADAFYSASLFQFKDGLNERLGSVMELGRTIISPYYQRDVQPLKLLLSALLMASIRNPAISYTLGPASMSNDIPDFYKSLIVYFLKSRYGLPESAKYAAPTHPFKSDFLRVNPDDLLVACRTADDLDRLIVNLSDGKYRMPVLLRKYISFGAKVVDCNVDPLFENCLDTLVLLDFTEMTDNFIVSFSKYMTPEDKEILLKRTNRI